MKIKKFLLLSLLLPSFAACGSADDADVTSADAGVTPTDDLVSITISLEPHEGTAGTLSIGGEDCESFPCSVDVPRDALMTLEAKPELHSTFNGWPEPCEEGLSCEFLATSNRELTVSFDVAGTMKAQRFMNSTEGAITATVDDQGNVYTGGGGGITKYDNSGEPLWSRSIAETGDRGSVLAIALAPNNTVCVGGDLEAANSPHQSPYVACLAASNGEDIWMRKFPASGRAAIRNLAVSESGRVFAHGVVLPSSSLSVAGQQISTEVGTTAVFVAALAPGGGQLGATIIPATTRSAIAEGILSIEGDGGFVTSSTVDLGGVLSQFDENGAEVSSVALPAAGAIAWTENDKLIMAGTHTGELSWGDEEELVLSAPTAANPSPKSNVYVVKLSLDGEAQWAESYGGTASELAAQVAVSSHGDIYVVGVADNSGSINLGGDVLPSFGQFSMDVFVASYSPQGEHRWSRTVGGESQDFTIGLHLADNGTASLLAIGTDPFTTELGTAQPPLNSLNQPPYQVVFRQ
jgi:hypothetical protein